MRECPNCKTMLEDDELFCHECGMKQDIAEVAVQDEEMAAPVEQECIHCGETIEAGSAFCPFCGKPQTTEIKAMNEDSTKNSETIKTEQSQENEITNENSDSEPEYVEKKKKSKVWLWILLILLIIGGAIGYSLSGNMFGDEVAAPIEDVDSIAEVQDTIDENETEEDEDLPSSKLDFLEKFYKEGHFESDYIEQRVTPDVLNRLRQAYDGECSYGDCLGTWVFLAFPQGANARIVGGPFISETAVGGRFKVDYVYSYNNAPNTGNETRTVYLTVIKTDGEYLISDYEVENYSSEEDDSSNEEEIGIDQVATCRKLIEDRKYDEALAHLRTAADNGNSDAMFLIGRLYEDGKGVTKSFGNALSWYKKAAELNNLDAIFYMGYYYEHGLGGPTNYAEALRCYRKAASKGNKVAMYNIGIMYLNGDGVERDRNEAIKWIKESAKLGDKYAIEWLKKNEVSI